jgi:antitoxin (DNA-binding transcriptional repressor) of toxin-antitoxin stability system
MVKGGEMLLITERNRPVAQLLSAAPGTGQAPSVEETLRRLAETRQIRLATKPLKRIRPRLVKGKRASRIILEDRQ